MGAVDNRGSSHSQWATKQNSPFLHTQPLLLLGLQDFIFTLKIPAISFRITAVQHAVGD